MRLRVDMLSEMKLNSFDWIVGGEKYLNDIRRCFKAIVKIFVRKERNFSIKLKVVDEE